MRAKNVNFVRGLKPNTRIYPFFDKVDVTNLLLLLCEWTKWTTGGKMFLMVVEVTGLFQIPTQMFGNPQFQTGERF